VIKALTVIAYAAIIIVAVVVVVRELNRTEDE
jgi:hypothetical protein